MEILEVVWPELLLTALGVGWIVVWLIRRRRLR
jgi:hypothetical protein